MSDAIKPVAWCVGASYWQARESVPYMMLDEAEPLYDQATLDAAIAAERDCRTCKNFRANSGGCVSVLRCTNGNEYKRAGIVLQVWEITPADAGF